MTKLVLTLAHDQNGHFGRNKVTQLITGRYFREKPSISNLVSAYIDGCLECKSKVEYTFQEKQEFKRTSDQLIDS